MSGTDEMGNPTGFTQNLEAQEALRAAAAAATSPTIYGGMQVGANSYNPNPYLANQLGAMGNANPMAALGQNNYAMSPASFAGAQQQSQNVRGSGLLAAQPIAPYAALSAITGGNSNG